MSPRLCWALASPCSAKGRDSLKAVALDYGEAMTWYLKAAEQGHANAQSNLAVMYNKAQGVSRDRVQACMWLKLAAKQDHEDAKHDLAETEAKLTEDQIADAERLAEAWLEKHCK